MIAPSLSFHHIGLLTGQPELAINRLRQLGYLPGETVFDPEQEVLLCMCVGANNELPIELVTPTPNNQSLSRLLKRRDDYMYHICFTTSNIKEGITALSIGKSDCIAEITPPKPAVLFGGRRVAFYVVPGLGLIELLEQPPEQL